MGRYEAGGAFSYSNTGYNLLELLIEEVTGQAFAAYGLGHYMETLPNGKQAISHGGQGTGIMTHFHAVPETGDAVVILTNSQRSWPFISSLLSDWARWGGFGPVGMGRITLGEYGMWAVIGLVWFTALLQILRLTAELMRRRRSEARGERRSGPIRIAQAGLAIAITGGLVWCLSQKYLLLSSVFPRASLWLGASAFALSVVLLLASLLMREKI